MRWSDITWWFIESMPDTVVPTSKSDKRKIQSIRLPHICVAVGGGCWLCTMLLMMSRALKMVKGVL